MGDGCPNTTFPAIPLNLTTRVRPDGHTVLAVPFVRGPLVSLWRVWCKFVPWPTTTICIVVMRIPGIGSSGKPERRRHRKTQTVPIGREKTETPEDNHPKEFRIFGFQSIRSIDGLSGPGSQNLFDNVKKNHKIRE